MVLDEGEARLTVLLAPRHRYRSRLELQDGSLRWECSPDTLDLAESLIEPLLDGAGHQFLDVSGEAEQVIISRDEYPAHLR